MNHPGELAVLTRMIRPHVAVITNVEAAHTAFFDSLDQVADAKAEILEGIEAGGTAVLNRDSPFFGRLAAAAARNRNIARIVSFGRDQAAEVRLIDAEIGAEASAVRASLFGREIAYRVGMPGPHWVMNSLATLAAVSALGADAERACRGARLARPASRPRPAPRVPHRGRHRHRHRRKLQRESGLDARGHRDARRRARG